MTSPAVDNMGYMTTVRSLDAGHRCEQSTDNRKSHAHLNFFGSQSEFLPASRNESEIHLAPEQADINTDEHSGQAMCPSSTVPVRCPDAIRDLPGWLIWRYEPSGSSNGKRRKVPYYAAGGRRSGVQGSVQDRRGLGTFEVARAAAVQRAFDGVGFATLSDFKIVALDFDNCVDDKGSINEQVMDVLQTTYAEFSPSGRGIRAFLRGQIGNLKEHGEPFGMELFSSKGFVTFTGNVLPHVESLGNVNEVAPIDHTVMALVRKRFKRSLEAQVNRGNDGQAPVGLTPSQLDEALGVLPTDLDYDHWIQVGMAIHHETVGEGFELWDSWSQSSNKYTDREYGLERWNSFGRGTGPAVTARSLVRLANEHGANINLSIPASAEEFEVMVEAGVEKSASAGLRFAFERAGQFATSKDPAWIVKGVLPQAGLAVVFGATGSGKSFAALDLAMAIARGTEWRGRKVRAGQVAYIAAEGAAGFRKRLRAYARHHVVDLEQVPLLILNAAPNLMLLDDAKDLAIGVLTAGGANVIVVDTWAQVTPGANENAGEDMGKALGHCKRLHEMTGALVVLIHHSGKDQAKGARGWSGLRAAADAEIEIIKREDGTRRMRLTKNKDGEDGLEWGFRLDIVAVGADEDGEPITSCVVTDAGIVAPAPAMPKGSVQRLLLVRARELMGSALRVSERALIDEALARLDSPAEGKHDRRRETARRALNSLIDDGFLTREGDDVVLA